jgi:hypothetical protein
MDMSKPGDNRESNSPRGPSAPTDKNAKAASKPVSKADYFSLAGFLQRREQLQRGHKRDPQSEAVRTAGELYGNREYIPAYESFQPIYERVVSDMQRVLARNIEIEAKKLAAQQAKSLAAAKENVQQMRAHAQQVLDQFEKLRQDLENKPLVRLHIKRGRPTALDAPKSEESSPTALNSANETRVDVKPDAPAWISIGNDRYTKTPYAPPEIGNKYVVRDKLKAERIICVIAMSADGSLVQVNVLEQGTPTKQPLQLEVDSLARQAAKGLCFLLTPIPGESKSLPEPSAPLLEPMRGGTTMRIDIQNFGRCCGSIALASIKYNTQVIKDVADGSFRAGEYEKAFLTFEQLVTGFSSAVNMSRQEIATARSVLTAEKGRLSGKEVQERTAALVRREQRIYAAEREFSTILEGLRMYLLTKK